MFESMLTFRIFISTKNDLKLLSEREIASILEENMRLKNLVQKQESTLSERAVTLSKKDAEILQKDSEIAWLKRMIFGQKRERFTATPEGQLSLPFEVDQKEVEQAVQTTQLEKEAKTKKEKAKHPGRGTLPTHLEVRETIIEPSGDLTDMVHVADEITEELEMEPAKYYIHRIVRRKYAPKSGEGSFMIAPMPDRVLDKAIAGAGVITQAIIDKYVDHLPLYRQLQRFAREGIHIKEPTIHHWVHRAIEKLEILYEYLWQQQVRCGYLQVDETTIKVLESEKKNAAHLGYYWVYNDPVGNIPMFKYEKGRAGAFPAQQLQDFKGFLQTDGYAGYNQLAERQSITQLCCWAHARREFEKALPNDKARAEMALMWIQQLYKIERDSQNLDSAQRKELRLEKALPILNAFFKWAAQQKAKVLPKSQIGKAINYSIERYDALMVVYLSNGNLHIDNNAVENSIRPIAIGRKNYLFANNHESAQRAAIIYTFMAICKKHNVNPYHWLKDTLLVIDQTNIQNLHSLLPQNFNKQDALA
ncbi:Transposase TnpC, homeodomain containing protein [Spirosomataceae bacterium]